MTLEKRENGNVERGNGSSNNGYERLRKKGKTEKEIRL